MPHGEALAKAARGLAGVRFRLHGRDPATGLDCIGLLHAALAATGRLPDFPNGYRLRSRSVAGLDAIARCNGLVAASGDPIAGDVVLVSLGGCQHHLLIALGEHAFIHAHAGIGRAVLHHGPPPGVIAGHWRLSASFAGT
jgi:cell wall-associated NlpC family hydrolase